jgi:dienelactone hydrolase
MVVRYFREEVARIQAQAFAGVTTLSDWTGRRETYREQLLEMLGLAPFPEKTDLQVTVTGRVEHAEFYVENLHFQSLPRLYVTANLYVPKGLEGKAPAILYVCGHTNYKDGGLRYRDRGGISYGAKVMFQHHGAWFARHGYVCLVIDTVEAGEIEGYHHGTMFDGMWWWNARGYVPSGVETWNAIRALDYLQSLPQVDGEKLGITGISGGGATSWFTAAVDDRIQAAVPVAGITDLQDQVGDCIVAGHCDCITMLNTHRWDFAMLPALIAPRPLLLANSDQDRIFPLDGVIRVHHGAAKIYRLHQATDKFGLLITAGGHDDTQELQLGALRWFDRFLMGRTRLIHLAAEKLFTPLQLKVFPKDGLPADEITTRIHETFVPAARPPVPTSTVQWGGQRDAWTRALREKSFGGWPATPDALALAQAGTEEQGPLRTTRWEFTSQSPWRLPLVVVSRDAAQSVKRVYLHVCDEQDWADRPMDNAMRAEIERGEATVVFFAPRGVGPTVPSADVQTDQPHSFILSRYKAGWATIDRRRHILLGQTMDGMRVWDIGRAVAAVRDPQLFGTTPIVLSGARNAAVNALYASLFIDGLDSVELFTPPASHANGPDYLNVLRFLDVPQAAAIAMERQTLRIRKSDPEQWTWTVSTARQLGWPGNRLQW